MGLRSWWQGLGTIRAAGLTLYKLGMSRANRHDSISAMEHYTAAIEMADMPEDIRAMALYNRALLHASSRDHAKAIEDLQSVLAMPSPLRQIKSAARQKLDRMARHHAAQNPQGKGS